MNYTNEKSEIYLKENNVVMNGNRSRNPLNKSKYMYRTQGAINYTIMEPIAR